MRASIAATGLAYLFDTVGTREDADRGKPSPDLSLEAARRLHVPPQRCLVVEGRGRGAGGGAGRGMRAADVLHAAVDARLARFTTDSRCHLPLRNVA